MRKNTFAALALCVCLSVTVLVLLSAGLSALADGGGDVGSKSEKKPEPADNSSCFVCHADYEEEPLVLWHAKEGVGCIDCHGESQDHADDEDHFTAPDTMYPAELIDKSCRECHATHDVPATEVIATWQKRCPKKTDPGKIVCTDCHGQHRLEKRKVRWDKKTGKLLDDE